LIILQNLIILSHIVIKAVTIFEFEDLSKEFDFKIFPTIFEEKE
jgi:hypothetical protein